MPYPNWIDIPENEALTNMFGAVEMETAACAIIKVLAKEKRWDAEVNYCEIFGGSDSRTRIGLFMLAVHGWIDDVETSGTFVMTESFAHRIVDLLGIPKERRHLAVPTD